MPLHSSLTGTDLHEVKGAASAGSKQILGADGAGSASFMNAEDLISFGLSSEAFGVQVSDLAPSAVDTPQSVTFSTVVNSSDVTVNTNGTITAQTDGLYFMNFILNAGKATGTATSHLVFRLLKNGSAFWYPRVLSFYGTETGIIPINASMIVELSSSDTLKMEFVRDSSGANEGGLKAVSISMSGWTAPPSAAVRISRILGET